MLNKTARSRLREETSGMHEKLESYFSSLQPNEEDPDISEYYRWLSILLIGYSEIIQMTNYIQVDRAEIESINEILIPKLVADLDGQSYSNLITAEKMISLAEVGSPAFLIGMLYVLRGSALGATLISKKIERLPDKVKCTYLRHQAKEARFHWSSFVAELDTLSEKDIPLAVEGAKYLFNRLILVAQS